MSSTPLILPSRRDALGELLRLAFPLVLVTASRMLMGFIDTLMVSRLGTDELAAILPATMLLWAFFSAGIGTACSVQTFASQADGRGEPERGAAYAWQTMYYALLLVPFTAAFSHYAPAIYAAIASVGGQTENVRHLQITYTTITVWSMIPAVFAAGLESFFNGVQRPRITLIATVASLVTNAVLNWVFIFGHLGSPAMGVWGAGLATVIGWWARVAVLLTAFLSPAVNARFHSRRAFALHLPMLGDVFRIGIPTALGWLLEVSAWVVFLNLIAPHYGVASLAATNIAIQYTHVAFMPAVGVGMALCSQVGFAIGARRSEEAVFRTRIALRVNMIYMALAGAFLFVARYPLMRAFTADAAVLEVGGWIMLWVSFYQLFDAMSISFIFAMRGAGDTLWPSIYNGACCWSIFVVGGALCVNFAPQFGIHGPWLLAASYLTLLGLLLLWRFESRRWLRVKVFGDQPAVPSGQSALESVRANSELPPDLDDEVQPAIVVATER